MRRTTLAIAVVGLLLATLVPASAAQAPEHSPGGDKAQSISGTLALPTRFTDLQGGFPGLGRRLFNCSWNTNGLITYIARVDEDAWGGPFEIVDVTAQATTPDIPDVDLDVFFYDDLADCEYPGGTPETLAEYQAGGPGEVGFTPEGAEWAVVFSPNAFNATFTMDLYEPPTVNIGDGDFTMTVASGATVVFHNDTEDYAWVRAADGSFDSSPGPGTGIRAGDDFRQQFSVLFDTTTVTVNTSHGTGTITVEG